ncbi:MAG: hypothetical protein JWM74_1690 [Myxococcaceae bacterium]|nr:hypothetical protein [Myxococcaceae bacterium]
MSPCVTESDVAVRSRILELGVVAFVAFVASCAHTKVPTRDARGDDADAPWDTPHLRRDTRLELLRERLDEQRPPAGMGSFEDGSRIFPHAPREALPWSARVESPQSSPRVPQVTPADLAEDAKPMHARLSDALVRCETDTAAAAAICSRDLTAGPELERCVKTCAAKQKARAEREAETEARRTSAERAAERRRLDEERPHATTAWPPPPSQIIRPKATALTMAAALRWCVAGVVESSHAASCKADCDDEQQAACDRSCAEQASAEIRRIVGPPH